MNSRGRNRSAINRTNLSRTLPTRLATPEPSSLQTDLSNPAIALHQVTSPPSIANPNTAFLQILHRTIGNRAVGQILARRSDQAQRSAMAQRVPDEELDGIIEQVNEEFGAEGEMLLPDDAKELFIAKFPFEKKRLDFTRDYVLDQFRKRTMVRRLEKKQQQKKRTEAKEQKQQQEAANYTSLDQALPALKLFERMLVEVSQHMDIRPLIEKMETSLRSVSCEDCRVSLKGYILELFLSYMALAQGGSVQEPADKADALYTHDATQYAVQAKYGTPSTLFTLACGAVYQLMGLSAEGVDKPETAEVPPPTAVRLAHLFVEAPQNMADELMETVRRAYQTAHHKSDAFTMRGRPAQITLDIHDPKTHLLVQRVIRFPDGSPDNNQVSETIVRQLPAMTGAEQLDNKPSSGDLVNIINLVSFLSPSDRRSLIDDMLASVKKKPKILNE